MSELNYSEIEFPRMFNTIGKFPTDYYPYHSDLVSNLLFYLYDLSDEDFFGFLRFFSFQPETGSKTKKAIQPLRIILD